MSKINLLELLQQDIEDIKGLVNYKQLGLTNKEMKKQAKGIILNLQEHLYYTQNKKQIFNFMLLG